MSESGHERDMRPTTRLDQAQIDALLLAILMREMDKKLEFERTSFATNNVLGTSSQARKAAREKRRGKRVATAEEHENLEISSGRSTDEN